MFLSKSKLNRHAKGTLFSGEEQRHNVAGTDWLKTVTDNDSGKKLEHFQSHSLLARNLIVKHCLIIPQRIRQ